MFSDLRMVGVTGETRRTVLHAYVQMVLTATEQVSGLVQKVGAVRFPRTPRVVSNAVLNHASSVLLVC